MNLPQNHSLHSIGITALSLVVAAASIFGPPVESVWILISLVAAVAIIGVPHGGLDHLTGRKLLENRFLLPWQFVFFPAYLMTAAVVAGGWFWLPLVTAVGFFLVSAWHFGMEDERPIFQSSLLDHVSALAVGGMIIWVPVLAQTVRITEILETIVPSDLFSIPRVMLATQLIAYLLLPMATFVIIRDVILHNWQRFLRNSSFTVLFLFADPLVSFGIYFCGWHSVRGLCRLAKTHRKTALQLAAATAPLTVGAIGLAMVAMWLSSSGTNISDATVQTLFVGLAAIAVPHLLLHGPIGKQLARSKSYGHGSSQELEAV